MSIENSMTYSFDEISLLSFSFYFSSLSYVGVSIAYYANAIGPYAELDGYEYSKATYYNVKSSYEW